ncbi:MAG TPA: hypothetical protein P5105_05330 [Victivallales bacterium]|nr:hypothetical protein [Victivallales bacterium]HRR28075.1 hypothetical protein [Victivallales bacterium]
MVDNKSSVRGYAFQLNGKDNIVIDRYCKNSGPQTDLPVRIQAAYKELNPSSEQLIFFSSYLDGAFCLNIKIPKMPLSEIKNALTFEMQRQIPLPVETLKWNFKVIATHENSLSLKIFLVKEEVWNKVISYLIDSNIKIDYFISPLFLLEHFTEISSEEFTDFFQYLMIDFSSGINDNDKAEKIKDIILKNYHFQKKEVEEDSGIFVAKLIASVIFGTKIPIRNLHLFELPSDLKPIRFRALKLSFLLLVILNLLLGFLLLFRYSLDARKKLGELKTEKRKIYTELQKIEREDRGNKSFDDFIAKISELDPGESEILPALVVLAKELPSSAWITSFSSRGREIDISISTIDETVIQSTLSKLSQSGEFSNVSVRNTRRNRDNSVTLYLKLTHNKN